MLSVGSAVAGPPLDVHDERGVDARPASASADS